MASQQQLALILAALVLASPAVAYTPEAAGYTPTAASSPAEAGTPVVTAGYTPGAAASTPAEPTPTRQTRQVGESRRRQRRETRATSVFLFSSPSHSQQKHKNNCHVLAVADVKIDASRSAAQKIPQTMFGLFFEEINYAGAGGLWAELVSNRGFEAGGAVTPSSIEPWSILGDASTIRVTTDRSSCFSRNVIALKMEVICEDCPSGGVGICNPGFWGMNIEQGKSYNLAMYLRSPEYLNFTASLTCSNGSQIVASASIQHASLSNWTKVELQLLAQGTCISSRLELTTLKRGIIWLDQVSVVPSDTHKGHGFRKELTSMLLDLRPSFLRFTGGCYVQGDLLKNAFRSKETIGPWEERPGHFGDVWHYWTDDGLGYYEFLQLAEDLGATPIWVVNIGISLHEKVNITDIAPLVEDVLDSLEFARGYVALGNEDCVSNFYREHYLKFYTAIREAYPDIQMISNCNGFSKRLDHPADLYDFHIYDNITAIFLNKTTFDNATRTGPKVFVSEYAVVQKKPGDGGNGSLVASLAEAAFLTGLEKNSNVVQMASYAPLFVNDNDRTWMPGAIVFNSWQHFLRVKIVNFGLIAVNLTISASGLEASVNSARSIVTVLISSNPLDGNSFSQPKKVVPVISELPNAAEEMQALLAPYSFTSFDLALEV
ncbi:hypothetical protein ACQ4PT_028025 [Festuca glaucescens]